MTNEIYVAGMTSGLAIGMVLLLVAHFRRRKGEYLDEPKNYPLLIAASVFIGLSLVCVALYIFANW